MSNASEQTTGVIVASNTMSGHRSFPHSPTTVIRFHVAVENVKGKSGTPVKSKQVQTVKRITQTTPLRVRFSEDFQMFGNEHPFITPEEYGSLWWSSQDFARFRKSAKKNAQYFVENYGDLKVMEEVLKRAETLVAISGGSEGLLRKNIMEDIGLGLCCSQRWQAVRGLEGMCCQALRKHLHKNKQIKMSTIQVFGQYSKDKYLGTFLERESRVSRILARIVACADAKVVSQEI